jgi:type II secretory pathway component PulF
VCACVSVLAGRSQVMYNAYDAPVMYAHAYSAFFIVFLLIALFGLANVVVPILYNEFRGHRRELSLSMYGWCCMCGAAVWWLCVYVCVCVGGGGIVCARVCRARGARVYMSNCWRLWWPPVCLLRPWYC